MRWVTLNDDKAIWPEVGFNAEEVQCILLETQTGRLTDLTRPYRLLFRDGREIQISAENYLLLKQILRRMS